MDELRRRIPSGMKIMLPLQLVSLKINISLKRFLRLIMAQTTWDVFDKVYKDK